MFCSLCTVASQAQGIFSTPIAGEYLRDYYIIHYVDQDTAASLSRDPYCGSKTYDGHLGTDFVLRDYKQMDSGMTVLAAAAGRVIKVVDTSYDRNTNGAVSLGFGNYIAIAHTLNGKNYYTYYAHLRKGSHLVDSGMVVTEGQALAQAACSGYCLAPHLHFEVWDDFTVLDPFSAPCSFDSKRASLWKQQLAYDTTFGVIQQGLSDQVLSYDKVREHPVARNIFTYSSKGDTVVSMWVELKGMRLGDSLIAEWRAPDHSLWYRVGTKSDAEYWLGWWWTAISHPAAFKGADGKWTVDFLRNAQSMSTQEFETRRLIDDVADDRSIPCACSFIDKDVFLQTLNSQYPLEDVRIVDLLGRDVAYTIVDQSPTRCHLRISIDNLQLFLNCRTGFTKHSFSLVRSVH